MRMDSSVEVTESLRTHSICARAVRRLRELRSPKFEHRNCADSSSLAFVLGKAWVAPRLLIIDAVPLRASQFADGHPVGLGSAFDTAVTGGG